jgi:CRISPR-associated protein Csb2
VALILEIEHLSGVCFAALGPDSTAPDWPIQPDRAFSALVAAWAARGADTSERTALAWLESLDPPLVETAETAPRTVPTVFVPPNDTKTRTGNGLDTLLGVSGRKDRKFPAVGALDREGGLITRMVWSDVLAADHQTEALDRIARDTGYVGHSSSLTRCRFMIAEDRQNGQSPRRPIYSGRLDILEQDFAAGRRPARVDDVDNRRQAAAPPASAFSPDWTVLEITAPSGTLERSGQPRKPDLRSGPLLAKKLRDALMSGYGRAGLGVPEMISGHEADGAPTSGPHLAIVPLADVGFAQSDASIHGFALIAPRGISLLDIPGFRKAAAAVAPYDDRTRTRRLRLFGDGWSFTLQLGGDGRGLASLGESRYLGPSKTWATVTPLVIDRHLKSANAAKRAIEVEDLIAKSCENIGLPGATEVGASGAGHAPVILADKHSAIVAAPSAAPSGGNPDWMRWRLPDRFASRTLTHAVVRFPVAVEGPVILGAGRFIGLGLCLPITLGAP